MAIRLLMLLAYPLMLLLRALAAVSGRDPLRLREPSSASLWITRAGDPERADYFSMDSRFEGAGAGGFGRIVAALLLRASGLFSPQRTKLDVKSRLDRDANIPDEVYTLW